MRLIIWKAFGGRCEALNSDRTPMGLAWSPHRGITAEPYVTEAEREEFELLLVNARLRGEL